MNETEVYDNLGQLIWELLETDTDEMERAEEDRKAWEEAQAED